ncbi:septum formation family protein [Conyzicola sp.]|uniref:septum formation family protein n=1 Tax=Conyzicola sp. TaxID=1969404 RepID=UPI003989918F
MSTSSRHNNVHHLDNYRRGIAYACLAIPLTIVVWLFVWQFGLITSVVAWAAAALAVRLYRYGSGWPPAQRGAVAVLTIVIVTIFASLTAAFVYDAARGYFAEPSASMLVLGRALADPAFGDWFVTLYLPQRDVWAPWLLNLVFALLLSLLGVAPTLARAFRGESAGRRVSVFLIPLTLVLAVAGVWSFVVVPANEFSAPTTTLPYVVGDCLPESREIAEADDGGESLRDRPVACDTTHAAEVVWAGTVDEPAWSGVRPGEDYFDGAMGAHCSEAFSAYVGVPWGQSTLQLVYYFPSVSSWTAYSDRDIACAVYDPAGTIDGSLAGAAR